jgi:hypothetical protein
MLKFLHTVIWTIACFTSAMFAYRFPFIAFAVWLVIVCSTARRKGPVYRWYLFRTPWLRIFLHRIELPDADRYPHNHPWTWARALILRGGYLEYRHGTIAMLTRERVSPSGQGAYEWFAPGDWNKLTRTDYHRIEHVSDGTWTLFFAGAHTGAGWGYLTPTGHKDNARPESDNRM